MGQIKLLTDPDNKHKEEIEAGEICLITVNNLFAVELGDKFLVLKEKKAKLFLQRKEEHQPKNRVLFEDNEEKKH